MDIMTCNLCDKPTKQFCNNCQFRLCNNCVSKHTGEFQSTLHEIVPFFDRKIKLAFPECQVHAGQRCEAHCKQCLTPVCMKCIIGPHNGHSAVELAQVFENRKQEIQNETCELEDKFIQYYTEKEVEIEGSVFKVRTEAGEFEFEKEKQREIWHQKVDSIFDKVGSIYQALMALNLAPLTAQQDNLRKINFDLNERVQQNKRILKSNNFFEVNNHVAKAHAFQRFPGRNEIKMPCLKTQAVNENEINIELGDFRARLMHHSVTGTSLAANASCPLMKKLIDKVIVVATILVNGSSLHSITCVGTEEAWVRGENKTIIRVDIHGSVKETVTTIDLYRPSGISVTNIGELVYSDNKMKKVNVVRFGGTERFIKTPQDYYPEEICCTRSGDILVHMRSTVAIKLNVKRRNKIVRYQEQMITQEIKNDEHGTPVFREGLGSLFMAENNNGDISVTDTNAKTVVTVNKNGSVRFRYDGIHARRKETFNPGYIVTDSLYQIIVTDKNNDCLHILDRNGLLLRLVDDCGLVRPWGLSIDTEERLWVALPHSGKIIVIQYLAQL